MRSLPLPSSGLLRTTRTMHPIRAQLLCCSATQIFHQGALLASTAKPKSCSTAKKLTILCQLFQTYCQRCTVLQLFSNCSVEFPRRFPFRNTNTPHSASPIHIKCFIQADRKLQMLTVTHVDTLHFYMTNEYHSHASASGITAHHIHSSTVC